MFHQDGDFLWLYRARKKPISASVMCTPVAPPSLRSADTFPLRRDRRWCHTCRERGHPGWSAPLLTRFSTVELMLRTVPSHLSICIWHVITTFQHQQTTSTQTHQCVSEDVDGCSSPSGCTQHVWHEGDVSLVISDHTVCSADRLHVISSAVCSGARPASSLPLLVFGRDYLIPLKQWLMMLRTVM